MLSNCCGENTVLNIISVKNLIELFGVTADDEFKFESPIKGMEGNDSADTGSEENEEFGSV